MEINKSALATYNQVTPFYDCPIPISKQDRLERYGILGILGYIVLYTLPNTHILEIGVGESSIYLTQLARVYSRKIYQCDITSSKLINPMTVNGYYHENRILVYQNKLDNINYNDYSAILFAGSSDAFFKQIKFRPISLAFIDGDHTYAQVKKDFDNTFNLLVDDGYIFLHDTYPDNEDEIDSNRSGDVYKLRQELEKRTDIDCFTFNRVVGVYCGITMIRKKSRILPYYKE